jgi:hypothetical protein
MAGLDSGGRWDVRAYPQLAALALLAGVITPQLGFKWPWRRLAGENEGDHPDPKRCPIHKGEFLIPKGNGWYYCYKCGRRIHESRLE